MGRKLPERKDFLKGKTFWKERLSERKDFLVYLEVNSKQISVPPQYMQVLSILRWMKNETKQTNTHTRQPHAPNLLQWIANVLNAGNGADGSKILNRAPCRKELNALVMFRKLPNVCHARSPFSHINKCYFWPKHRLRLEHHSTQWLNTIIEQKSVFLILNLAVFRPPFPHFLRQ